MDVGVWLRGLDLGQYEPAFRENDVDAGLLPTLTADDLRELGVASLGHRKRLLAAIAALAPPADPPHAPTPPTAGDPPASETAPQAERRQLTVAFVDLVGSTALSARLDPEEMHELLRVYQRAVTTEVGRHGGRVAKYLGDGVLAYFGFPRAQEDDVERAVQAGLAAVEATAALRSAGASLAARVGIATGVVVVGDLIGEGAAREEAVVGETPNLAARLQSVAEPGSVVIAERTRQLVGGLFACIDLGPIAAKGFPEPVRAFRVLHTGPVESRFEALRPTLAPLVGREEELELLLRRWEVFEDAHWIDPSSRELLDLTIERLTRLPALLILTHRPEFQPPWTGQPNATTLVLSRLTRREGAALVRGVADTDLPEALVEEIVERTDGVPLFIEELTKAALEAGGNAAAHTLATASPAALAVPATLHASLLARLDRLVPAARAVAQVGAVIGREFPNELLADVAGLDEAELADALNQLATAGLVFRTGAGSTAGHLFKHALVRDAAYGTLLRDRRRQLHAAVARALEERWPELAETAPELIAFHLAEAGEAECAVRYWLDAGRRAAERSAEREAVSHLRRGLEMLAGLPASFERDRSELDLLLALGARLISTSGHTNPEVAVIYERAMILCENLDDAGGLRSTLFGLYAHHVVRGECRAALSFAKRLRASAERGGDPAERLLGRRALGTALMQLGQFEDARSELEAVFALRDTRRDRALAAGYNVDPYASALGFVSLVLCIMGFPQQAKRAAREAIQSAAELGHASTTSVVRLHAGAHLAALLLDGRAAELHADAVVAEANERSLQAWKGAGTVLRGWALARNGRVQEGLAIAQQGITHNDALGAMWHAPRFLVLLAEIHAQLGDCTEALSLVEEAQARVRQTGERLWEAEACFAAALAVARQQKARWFELRAATSLARLRRDQGRRDEARAILQPVYAWFAEGLDTPDLRNARELLDEPPVAPPL